jgi:hypothetical protein
MEEIWKDVEEYEGLYQVSDKGNVKSQYWGGKILKPKTDKDGYKMIYLSKYGKKSIKKVHRIVATTFIDNPKNLPQVNHKDENKANNDVNNLEWCTQQYNLRYGTARERQVEHTDYKKLAMKNRKEIIQLDKSGNVIRTWKGINEAAMTLGLTRRNISACLHGWSKSAGGYAWKMLGASGEWDGKLV